MTDEFWKTIGIIVGALSGSRLLSHFEHRKTEKKIDEIHFYMNGEMVKKIDAAREEGREEERNKK